LSNRKLPLIRLSSPQRAVDFSCFFRYKAERRFGVLRLSEIKADYAMFTDGCSIADEESHLLCRESHEQGRFRHKRATIVRRSSSSKNSRAKFILTNLKEFWLFRLLLNRKYTLIRIVQCVLVEYYATSDYGGNTSRSYEGYSFMILSSVRLSKSNK